MFSDSRLNQNARSLASAVLLVLLALAGILKTSFGQRQPAPSPPAPVPTVLQNYSPVTAERLLHPEDGNWLMIRRTYEGWGYSPLDQITPSNVTRNAGNPQS